MSFVGIACKNCGRAMIYHDWYAKQTCKRQWRQKVTAGKDQTDMRSYF